jgi:hypothetical protein
LASGLGFRRETVDLNCPLRFGAVDAKVAGGGFQPVVLMLWPGFPSVRQDRVRKLRTLCFPLLGRGCW